MAIVTRGDVDQFAFLKRQIIQEACRPDMRGPDALLHRHEDVDRPLARRSTGLLRDASRAMTETLWGKAREPISHAMSVSYTRGMSSIVLAFERRRQGTAFPRVFDLPNRVCCDSVRCVITSPRGADWKTPAPMTKRLVTMASSPRRLPKFRPQSCSDTLRYMERSWVLPPP